MGGRSAALKERRDSNVVNCLQDWHVALCVVSRNSEYRIIEAKSVSCEGSLTDV